MHEAPGAEPGGAATPALAPASATTLRGVVLGTVLGLLTLGALLLLLGGPAALPRLAARWQQSDVPPYREVTPRGGPLVLGRDLVIDPADATAREIERLVGAVAAADDSPLLRLNVFTSEAAAQRRRELVAAGRFTLDETRPNPPEWAEVNRAWAAMYTRDRDEKLHQLTLCFDDPDHDRCTVQRLPLAAP